MSGGWPAGACARFRGWFVLTSVVGLCVFPCVSAASRRGDVGSLVVDDLLQVRERKRDRETERERKGESECECVCVCVRVA